MDRDRTRTPFNSSSMPTYKSVKIELLLRRSKATRLRAFADEKNRRDVHQVSVLRFKKNSHRVEKGRVCDQQEKSSEAHEKNGISSHSPRTKYLSKGSRAQSIPILAKRCYDYKALRGLEHGYYFHSLTKWFRVSCSYHGLVQQDGVIIPSFEQLGSNILFRCLRRSLERVWKARGFQYRPGSAIHLWTFRRGYYKTRHSI